MESIFSAFLQDDLRLGSAVVATVGARLEKVTSLNWQVQPTARVMWSPGERQHVWGAVSRGVRTPSLQERRIRIAFPPVDMGLGLPLATQIAGNPDMRPETVVSVEAGYRVSAARLEVDASVFRSRYADLRSMEAGAPEVHVGPDGPFLLAVSRFDNLFAADSTGAEMLGRLRLRPGWRAEAGVTLFHLRPRLHSSSRDTVLVDYDGGAPKLQMFLRNSFMTGPNDFDLFLSMVGRLVKTGVPAYGRLDLRWERRLSAAVSLAAVGQNLLQADHFEGDRADVMQLPTSLPRSVNLQLRWRIR